MYFPILTCCLPFLYNSIVSSLSTLYISRSNGELRSFSSSDDVVSRIDLSFESTDDLDEIGADFSFDFFDESRSADWMALIDNADNADTYICDDLSGLSSESTRGMFFYFVFFSYFSLVFLNGLSFFLSYGLPCSI